MWKGSPYDRKVHCLFLDDEHNLASSSVYWKQKNPLNPRQDRDTSKFRDSIHRSLFSASESSRQISILNPVPFEKG